MGSTSELDSVTDRVLVSSLTPASGGVATMTRFILETLQSGGCDPLLAHYEPYGMTPQLSTPIFALGMRRPGSERRIAYDGVETHAIGAWFPELEFTHFRPGGAWQALMDRCNRFVSVSGNVLAATPFASTKRPFLSWVATGWQEDRCDRVRRFPIYRKALDSLLNAQVLRKQEQRVLRHGHILALSQRTQHVLNQIAGQRVVAAVMPMPIDTKHFRPDPAAVKPARIGFMGRFNDPRKNIDLLIEAFATISEEVPAAELVLVGGRSESSLQRKIVERNLSDRVRFTGFLGHEELIQVLQTLDVFAIPSRQEGLCIAALEAMACGCPVVSTRCGGPEEFVLQHETGYLVDFDLGEMASALVSVVSDRHLRGRLGESSRRLVIDRYNKDECARVFWRGYERTFAGKNEVAA